MSIQIKRGLFGCVKKGVYKCEELLQIRQNECVRKCDQECERIHYKKLRVSSNI